MNLSFWNCVNSFFPCGSSTTSSSALAMNVLQVCSLQLDLVLTTMLVVRLESGARGSSSCSHCFSMFWLKETLRHFSIKFFAPVLNGGSKCYFVSIEKLICNPSIHSILLSNIQHNWVAPLKINFLSSAQI